MILVRLELELCASGSRGTFLKLRAGIQLWNPDHRRRVQGLVSSEVVLSDGKQGRSGMLFRRGCGY